MSMLQSSSASQIAAATADRESKLQNLKNKIIWVCCAKSLSPPLQYVGALKYEKNDTEDEKIARRIEHTAKVNEREEERIRREPELLKELEKIMDRVKQARLEYSRPEIDYAASANALAIVRYYCEKCNNQVSDPTILIIHDLQQDKWESVKFGNYSSLCDEEERERLYDNSSCINQVQFSKCLFRVCVYIEQINNF